jgi:hypothetical protein
MGAYRGVLAFGFLFAILVAATGAFAQADRGKISFCNDYAD